MSLVKLIVRGTYGDVFVDAEGKPIGGTKWYRNQEVAGIAPEYEDIVKFDISEFKNYLKEYTKEDPEAEDLETDILSIGFTYKDANTQREKFSPSNHDYRVHVRAVEEGAGQKIEQEAGHKKEEAIEPFPGEGK